MIGGIPEGEVAALQVDFDRFGIHRDSLFQPERTGYLAFREEVSDKTAIKQTLEADPALQQTLTRHHEAIEEWWTVARDDFAKLRDGKKMPEVRQELLTTMKDKLTNITLPMGGSSDSEGRAVLDEFKSAGVFVNWWQQIRYDLKTIVSTGWHHTLILDEYLIAEFFQAEADEIESAGAAISEAQSELAEAVETATEVAGYEPEEDEKVTPTVVKHALKDLIDDLKDTKGESAKKELANLKSQEKTIKAIEKRIKDSKAKLKDKTDELELKLQLKRLGGEEFKAENEQLLKQIDEAIKELDPKDRAEKRKINALKKDAETINERLAKTDALLTEIGGELTEAEAKRLILKKLYDVANTEMNRYLNAEKRRLISGIENLSDKYAVSSRELEGSRTETLETLENFLSALGYAHA